MLGDTEVPGRVSKRSERSVVAVARVPLPRQLSALSVTRQPALASDWMWKAPADEVSAWLPGLRRIVPGPPTTVRLAQGDWVARSSARRLPAKSGSSANRKRRSFVAV